MFSPLLFPCVVGLAAALALPAQGPERFKVGIQPDGRVVVPTNQVLKPAGRQVTFPGRPIDLALTEDGQTLVVKNMKDLVFIDVATATIRQSLELKGVPPLAAFDPDAVMKKPIAPDGKGSHYPTGFSVVGLLLRGDRVYASDSKNHVQVARRQKDGTYAWEERIGLFGPKVGGDAYPAGIAPASGEELWVASSRGNTVQLLDLATAQAQQAVAVGVAPYMVCCPRPDRCYVSNWGGDPPPSGAPQDLSSGTPVAVERDTGVADQGSVSVLAPTPGRWKQVKTIRVGSHPSGMVAGPGGRFL
jgi:DNA-binding beta-propeller fold protein YncE